MPRTKAKKRPHHKRRQSPATKPRRGHRNNGGTPAKRTPKQIIAEAAKHEGVPFWVLYGVWGVESGFSKNPGTSSAGAVGPFQFIPSTAQGLGIKNPLNFRESAFGAAKYLRSMHDQYGSWNAALEGYNAGPGNIGKGVGYTESIVKSKAKEKGVTPKNSEQQSEQALAGLFGYPFGPNIGPDLNPLPNLPSIPGLPSPENLLGINPIAPIESFIGAADATTRVLSLITDPKFWLRVAEGIGGLILIYMALKALTGREAPGVAPAKRIATDAAKAAAFKRMPPKTRVKG